MPRNACSICGISSHESVLYRGENDNWYCRACIESEHMVKCAHDGCGLHLKPEEAYLSGDGFLCREHWEKKYDWCSCCGALIIKKYSYELPDGKRICEHCFENKYFICDDCGKTFPAEEAVEIEIGGAIKHICSECRNERYAICTSCGNLTMIEDFVHISYRKEDGSTDEIHACRNCAETVAHQCSHCGGWFEKSIPFHDEDVCDRCYYRYDIIHNYSFKPKARPRVEKDENSELLFGIENEIELKFGDPHRSRYSDSDNTEFRIETPIGKMNVDYKRYVAYKIDTSIPGFFYQKNDGSIGFGMEIVSHPATLEFWRSQKDKIEELFSFLRSEGCEGDRAESVGMHIHVSRNNMKRSHQNSFAAFVYSHRTNIEKLAGRPSNGYTKMIRLPNSAADSDETKRFEKVVIDNDDRYSAVNWRNKNTVELRMFQSTLNTSHFIANIEFSHALYHFSKERTVLECVNADSWMNFCNFVSDSKYEYLKIMMVEKDIFVS